MLAVFFKIVLGLAILPSTPQMLKLEISEGLRLLERGAYHGPRASLPSDDRTSEMSWWDGPGTECFWLRNATLQWLVGQPVPAAKASWDLAYLQKAPWGRETAQLTSYCGSKNMEAPLWQLQPVLAPRSPLRALEGGVERHSLLPAKAAANQQWHLDRVPISLEVDDEGLHGVERHVSCVN